MVNREPRNQHLDICVIRRAFALGLHDGRDIRNESVESVACSVEFVLEKPSLSVIISTAGDKSRCNHLRRVVQLVRGG
jgi:hypothetical protein